MKKLVTGIVLAVVCMMIYTGCGKKEDKAPDQEKKTSVENTEQQTGKPAGKESAKPAVFPEQALEQVKDALSKGSPALSMEKIKNLLPATQKAMEYERSQQDKIAEALKDNGFTDIEDYTKTYLGVASGIEALKGLAAIQKIIDASAKEKKAAESLTLDQAVKSIASQSIKMGKLTEQDLKLVYDNWDMINELIKTLKEASKKKQ